MDMEHQTPSLPVGSLWRTRVVVSAELSCEIEMICLLQVTLNPHSIEMRGEVSFLFGHHSTRLISLLLPFQTVLLIWVWSHLLISSFRCSSVVRRVSRIGSSPTSPAGAMAKSCISLIRLVSHLAVDRGYTSRQSGLRIWQS